MGKGNNKEYYCCICKKKLNYKPLRLVHQVHDNREDYGRYWNRHTYDFCKAHYAVFQKWIDKHNAQEWR